MKKVIFIILTCAVIVSCQKQLIMQQKDGSISVHLENSPVVEVVTKAGGDVPVDDFHVMVSSETATYPYLYKEMPQVIVVPAGMYTVSAYNVTEEQALSQPDLWGQVRYAGTSEAKEVVSGAPATEFSLTCTMANTAVSIVFGENIDMHFDDFTVTAYTDDSRRLVYDAQNTVGETPAVGYFSSKTLTYEFSGTYMDEKLPLTITGSRTLAPATHLHLTFRISEQNGELGKPEIVVDATCEDLYETITVDPSDGGSFVTN